MHCRLEPHLSLSRDRAQSSAEGRKNRLGAAEKKLLQFATSHNRPPHDLGADEQMCDMRLPPQRTDLARNRCRPPSVRQERQTGYKDTSSLPTKELSVHVVAIVERFHALEIGHAHDLRTFWVLVFRHKPRRIVLSS